MIVDSSALVAILSGEPDARRYVTAIAQAARARISAANFLEAAIVLEGRGAARNELDDFLAEHGIQIEPVTADHARRAREAWRRFGKGNHPAGLNFGDCFAYALADAEREPLLFKGDDFARTDVGAA